MCYHQHPIPFAISHCVETSLRYHSHSWEELAQRHGYPDEGFMVGTTVKSIYLKDILEPCHKKSEEV